jgi:hypothetical protein
VLASWDSVHDEQGSGSSSLHPQWLWGPSYWLIGTGASSLDIKLLWCEADRSSPSSAEIENVWNYTSTPHCLDSMLLNTGQDDFALLPLVMLIAFL